MYTTYYIQHGEVIPYRNTTIKYITRRTHNVVNVIHTKVNQEDT